MALPRLPARALGISWWDGPTPSNAVLLEVFVDFLCPFSKRIFDRLTQEVIPKYSSPERPLKVVFQIVPQPWHPQSTMLSEAAIIAQMLGQKFEKPMTSAIFENALKFVDAETLNKSRGQIYEELASVAETAGISREEFLKHTALDLSDGQRNSGNAATRVLKFYTKQHRQIGIHVTPTIRLNGIVTDSSSGWTLEEWSKFLDPIFHHPSL